MNEREESRPACPNHRRDNKAFASRRAQADLRERLAGPKRLRLAAEEGSGCAIPAALLRDEITGFSGAWASWKSLRHFTRLSQRNFAIESQFYPLGSCTMKYNPKINESVARFPGFAQIHPLAPRESAAGRFGAALRTGGNACRDQRHGAREPAAVRRRPRRAHRADADPRLSRRTRQSAQENHRARHGARHQSGELDVMRLRRRADFFQCARRHRCGGGGESDGRRRRRSDDHQSQHSRPV